MAQDFSDEARKRFRYCLELVHKFSLSGDVGYLEILARLKAQLGLNEEDAFSPNGEVAPLQAEVDDLDEVGDLVLLEKLKLADPDAHP